MASKKSIDVEKVREAIQVLKDAREILDEIEEVLPRREGPVPQRDWLLQIYPERPWPYYPTYTGTTANWTCNKQNSIGTFAQTN